MSSAIAQADQQGGSKPPNRRQKQKPEGSKPQPAQSGKLRGNPRDSPNVQLSKTLSWLLRHGAKSEGLPMRPDGYVSVQDLLALPRLKELDFQKLQTLVADDAKHRYSLLLEGPASTENSNSVDSWWIRANQGHSMKVEVDYEPLTSASQVPMAVHGTNRAAWENISKSGLSKMKRTHIHMAQGVPGAGVISGMRKSADVLIYVDLQKALGAGIEFFLSANGVVLSAGDERGFIAPQYFSRVEDKNGVAFAGWDGEKCSKSVDSIIASAPPPTEIVPEVVNQVVTTDVSDKPDIPDT